MEDGAWKAEVTGRLNAQWEKGKGKKMKEDAPKRKGGG